MTEVCLGGGRTAVSPDSDCNSNHPGSTSCLSNTSSQDIDFIQDNSDYQWFLEYGYRDTNHHTSILSLPESYEASDGYYDALAKNMDANLAEADMESFKTEDIHALLTNLPPMCTDHLSQENNRQGESFASVSGSMMAKFDFDSSISPHSSSQGDESANSTSMSICKSELLFSPVKETPMPGANFSVDSLDCELLTEHDIMLTCQANKENYTIAFEGSVTMYSEDSDYHETDKSDASGACSTNLINDLKSQVASIKALQRSMTQSDSGSFTTWSKLKKRSSDIQLRRLPSGNNNESGDETSHHLNENVLKSQSMPNLYRQKLRGLLASNYLKQHQMNASSMEQTTVKPKPVKVFDIQHQIQSSSGSGGSIVSEMATSVDAGSSSSEGSNKQQNFSLVKLFMKQKSMSAEGMSTALDQSSLSENWPVCQSGDSNLSETKHAEASNKDTFEDSLLVDNKTNDTAARTYDLIVEEQDEEISGSESVEQLSESISESLEDPPPLNKPTKTSFNLNNNNSLEMKENLKKMRCRATNTRSNFDASDTSSSGSLSDRKDFVRPKYSKNIPIHLIHRSMQTSCLSDIISKNVPYKLNCNNVKDNIKVIEPSFLSKLKQEAEVQKPVYVLYPNYVLPDLDFLKKQDISKVLLVPQKAPETAQNKKRPFSCNDMEALKKKGFGHVQDWDSLNFLLPNEYRKVLANVPEVAQFINNGKSEKPSFCESPLMKHKQRPLSCDYSSVLERQTSLDRTTNVSSSSGYRGSSSMLDSQGGSPAPVTNFNPLFVYRYDSVTSSEASLINEKQKSITTAPPLPKRSNSLDPYKSDLVPPRPPLPRSILRKGMEKLPTKRYSMFVTEDELKVLQKRKSLPEPYYIPRNKRLSETEDEGVDAGTSSSSLDEPVRNNSPAPQRDILFANLSNDEIAQLEEFLKISGISSDHDDLNEESMIQLRSYVGKFLSLKMNQELAEQLTEKKVSFAEIGKQSEAKVVVPPNNSPNVSAVLNQRQYQTRTLVDMPICEEGETSPENYSSPQTTPKHKIKYPYEIAQKRSLITAVTDAVEKIIHHFSPATNQTELTALGDSTFNPACAKLTLSTLCPALYAVLSDGLKSNLETSFGAIHNSVWQVVEASAQQGPLTKSLNELVMRINGEDVITEGLVKFNSFVFGLLNVRSLDAWASYLRTRETVLRKHYDPDSLLLLSHTGGTNIRTLVDTLISSLQPLALLPFNFDLLFEYRQLHLSFKRMGSLQQLSKIPSSPVHILQAKTARSHSNSESEETSNYPAVHTCELSKTKGALDKPRPRSCVESSVLSKTNFKLGEDVTTIQKKRWSGISLTSKLYQAYNTLAHENSEEEYTDSLETTAHQRADIHDEITKAEDLPQDGPESLDSNIDEKPLNGRRFKKLQRKWEMLSGKESQSPPESPTNKSKIPRFVSSPNKPSGIPIPITTPTGKAATKIQTKKVITPPNGNKRLVPQPISRIPSDKNILKDVKKTGIVTRTSRLDQLEGNSETTRHATRPSSLPYKSTSAQSGKNSKIIPPRRAVSTSVNRKPQNKPPKVVRTLSHRLPSESGHLSYNEGEKLKVVLEVDEKWLLCCRGTQKGLVPKSAVIADSSRF